jgi:hypothetical protein
MRRNIIVSTFVLLTIVFSFVFAQAGTAKAKPVKTSKSILILKDTTKLEASVSQLLRDTLSKLGYTVKEAAFADIGKEIASSYKISIIFSAVNTRDEPDPRIDKFIASKGKSSSEVKLFTVCGALFDKKDEKTDAITQASAALHPQMIADQIMKSLKL